MATVLLLGTGGTIAGWAAAPEAQQHYQAGALAGAALLASLPAGYTPPLPVQVEDFARINSKDADARFWWRLYARLQAALADEAVAGVVITHGTDTLEETAFFLSELLPQPPKPVLLVSAMRPASHPEADGPQNLADALSLAAQPACAAYGVLATAAGQVWPAAQLQKWHGTAPLAFVARSRMAAALCCPQEARLAALGQAVSAWPAAQPVEVAFWQPSTAQCAQLGAAAHAPWVEIISSHAAANGRSVQALLAYSAALPAAQKLRAVVLAGTGCGTIHTDLDAALQQALAQGVVVYRSSQCLGDALPPPEDVYSCWPELSPKQSRVRAMLRLWQADAAA